MRKKQAIFIFVVSLISLQLYSGNSAADFYKYTAKDGSVHFVDDISKIPSALRDQTEQYKETASPPQTPVLNSEPIENLVDRPQDMEDQDDERLVETRVEVHDSHVLVPVKLGDGRNEIEVMMVMDTGSAKMVLNKKVANKLYLEPLGNIIMVAADGRRVQAETGMIGNMELGPFKLANVPAVIMPDDNEIGYSGLLGFEVLKNFKYTVDFQQEVIRWGPLPEKK
jgi:predicted aspartyl protease